MDDVSIREATITDFEAINLLNESSLGYAFDLYETKKQLQKILKKSYYKVFVAEVNSVVIGYVHGSDYDNTFSKSLKNIMGISVLKSWQGKGIGKLLLNTIEEWAKEDNCSGVRLVSGLERTSAHLFYEHCGYQKRKEQFNFIKWV